MFKDMDFLIAHNGNTQNIRLQNIQYVRDITTYVTLKQI